MVLADPEVTNAARESAALQTSVRAYRYVQHRVMNDPVSSARYSFAYFCKFFLKEHFSSKFGEFHLKIIKILEELRPGRNCLMLLPREHGKSTLIDFAFTLWNVCFRKKRHIGILSSTAENGQKFLNKLKQELENNIRIRYYFGDLVGTDRAGAKNTWRVSYIKTTNQVVVFANAIDGSIRGTNESVPEDLAVDWVDNDRRGRPRYRNIKSFRPDLLVFDDVIEDKFVKSRTVRDHLWNWFWSVAYNVPDSTRGNIVIVGTTIHDDDLVMRLWKDKSQTAAWLKVKMPACAGFDKNMMPVDTLWGDYWGQIDYNRPCDEQGVPYLLDEMDGVPQEKIFYLTRLAWKRLDLGSRVFAKEFLLTPFDDATKYFDRTWFHWWIKPSTNITNAQLQNYATLGVQPIIMPSDLICVTAIDPAAARGHNAEEADRDYTAIVTVGYSPSLRKYFVVDCDRFRGSALQIIQVAFRHFTSYNGMYGGSYYPSGTVGVGDPVQLDSYVRGWSHLGILVESVALQKMLADLIDEMSVNFGYYANTIEVKRGRQDKTTRALGVSAPVERRQVVFPLFSHHDMRKPDLEAMMDELDRFPQAEHDDTVDSFVDALAVLQRLSLDLNRGLNAQRSLRAMVERNPTMYAFVARRERDGMDLHDAARDYGIIHGNIGVNEGV